jgi:DNA polymerase-3 subunit gamma/tau
VSKNTNTSNGGQFEVKMAENPRQSTTFDNSSPAPATLADAPRGQTSQAQTSQTKTNQAQTNHMREIADWPTFVAAQNFLGMAGMLAKQAEFLGFSGNVLSLAVPESQKHLADRKYLEKLKSDLSAEFGDGLRINVKVGDVGSTGNISIAVAEDRARSEAQRLAEDSIVNDPFIKNINDDFGATIDRAAIRPIAH